MTSRNTDIREVGLSFEAVKVSMTQDKNGYNLRLCVHPDEVTDELFRDWVGSRYLVVMVKLTDDDQPEIRPDQLEKQRLVTSAIMCCKDPNFWEVLQREAKPLRTFQIKSENDCSIALKSYLNITSRKDLATNEIAETKFKVIRSKYLEHIR